MVTGGFFSEIKRLGREAGHSPPIGLTLRMSGAIPPSTKDIDIEVQGGALAPPLHQLGILM
jgi:hypothetical protein